MIERDLKLDGFTITVKALMLEQATQPGSQKISKKLAGSFILQTLHVYLLYSARLLTVICSS